MILAHMAQPKTNFTPTFSCGYAPLFVLQVEFLPFHRADHVRALEQHG
jgi:hypothetical protein